MQITEKSEKNEGKLPELRAIFLREEEQNASIGLKKLVFEGIKD